eukprot:8472601-Pyramimonas_sp.AAC.1
MGGPRRPPAREDALFGPRGSRKPKPPGKPLPGGARRSGHLGVGRRSARAPPRRPPFPGARHLAPGGPAEAKEGAAVHSKARRR